MAEAQRAVAAAIGKLAAAVEERCDALRRVATGFRNAAGLTTRDTFRRQLELYAEQADCEARTARAEVRTYETELKRKLKEAETSLRRASGVRAGGFQSEATRTAPSPEGPGAR